MVPQGRLAATTSSGGIAINHQLATGSWYRGFDATSHWPRGFDATPPKKHVDASDGQKDPLIPYYASHDFLSEPNFSMIYF